MYAVTTNLTYGWGASDQRFAALLLKLTVTAAFSVRTFHPIDSTQPLPYRGAASRLGCQRKSRQGKGKGVGRDNWRGPGPLGTGWRGPHPRGGSWPLCSRRRKRSGALPLAGGPRRDVIMLGAVRRINSRPEAGVVVVAHLYRFYN